jgi:hypothetical protein
MKKLIALLVCVVFVATLSPVLKADNSVIGTGKARDLKKKVEGQGSTGVTTTTNAPKPKANSAPVKK